MEKLGFKISNPCICDFFPSCFRNPSDYGYIFQPEYVAEFFAKQTVVFRLHIVKFTLGQATKAQWGSRGLALLFLHLCARCGWVVNATPRPRDPREIHGTHCTRGWMGPIAGVDGLACILCALNCNMNKM